MKFKTLSLLASCLFISGCSTSSLVVGKTRTPVSPDDVHIYFSPPTKYENIAMVSSDSNGSFQFAAGAKVNAAIKRCRKEAGKLGANGLLIQGYGESGPMTFSTANAYANRNYASANAISVSGSGLIRSVSAMAIWVTEE